MLAPILAQVALSICNLELNFSTSIAVQNVDILNYIVIGVKKMSNNNSLQFGLSIDPAAARMAESFKRATLGAGAYWESIEAYGGLRRTPSLRLSCSPMR